jgi:hypothetical protein
MAKSALIVGTLLVLSSADVALANPAGKMLLFTFQELLPVLVIMGSSLVTVGILTIIGNYILDNGYGLPCDSASSAEALRKLTMPAVFGATRSGIA